MQISAASADDLWVLVAGSRLFRSADRGDSWEERPLPGDWSSGNISFVSDRLGWLAMWGSAGTQCQIQSVMLWRTGNAGATWERLAPTGIADRQCKGPIAFVDDGRGFLATWSSNDRPVIYRTSDGGRRWTASPALPDPPGFTTRGAAITLRAGAVRAFGSTLLVPVYGTAERRTYVYRSSDGGASWSYFRTVPDSIDAFALVTGTRWVGLGPDRWSQETVDGGATWRRFATDYSQAAPVAPSVVFGSTHVGYAEVRGVIRRTTDSGVHWTDLRTPGTT